MNNPGVIIRGAVCLLAALLLAAGCSGLDKQDPLSRKERNWLKEHVPVRVGADLTNHPFSFVGPEGQPEGICVGLWKAMAQKLDFEVRFIPMDKPAQMAGLREGRLDSTTGMFPLAERRVFFDFSSPFYPVATAIFLRVSSKDVFGMEGLRRLRVGAVKGDSGAGVLAKNGIAAVLFDSYRGCVEALGQGQVDAAVMDDPVMLYWRQRLGLGSKISWAGGNAVVERNDLALPVKKGNTLLLSILNKGLALVSGAELQRLRERYLR